MLNPVSFGAMQTQPKLRAESRQSNIAHQQSFGAIGSMTKRATAELNEIRYRYSTKKELPALKELIDTVVSDKLRYKIDYFAPAKNMPEGFYLLESSQQHRFVPYYDDVQALLGTLTNKYGSKGTGIDAYKKYVQFINDARFALYRPHDFSDFMLT